jgi:hypothetical protein
MCARLVSNQHQPHRPRRTHEHTTYGVSLLGLKHNIHSSVCLVGEPEAVYFRMAENRF